MDQRTRRTSLWRSPMKPSSALLLIPVFVGVIWGTASCDSDASYSFHIEPAGAHAVVDPDAPTAPIKLRAFATNDATGAALEVTGETTWKIVTPQGSALGALASDGTFTPGAIG